MKLTYLGTAAAEGFPAIFCNCDNCIKARKLGGKNIRTRSQTLLNDDFLIDYPADSYQHFLANNIEGDKIKYLLITHSHQDHFYPKELALRKKPFAHNMRSDKLSVYCGKGAYDKLVESGYDKESISVTLLEHFKPVRIGEYTVTAMPARHFDGDDALIYIIENDGKTLLYAHDTGYFFDEVFEYISKNKLVFDMVSFDCTNIDIPVPDTGTHMGRDNVMRAIEKLKNLGALKSNTVKYINHFSHNGNPLHDELLTKAAEIDCNVSYDGCDVNF